MEIKVCNNVEVGSSLVCLENSGIQKDKTGDSSIIHAFECHVNEFDLTQ